MPDLSGWAAAAYVGIFEMGITFLIWMKALSLARETARISMLIYLSPFFSLVLIGTVLGEPILITTIAGLVLIVMGLLIQGRERSGRD
jgi:drug/metabolite transporter (DMT)-like permease